ncbi:MAG: hypothetical protein ACR2IT_01990 [Pirellulales bacterium]
MAMTPAVSRGRVAGGLDGARLRREARDASTPFTADLPRIVAAVIGGASAACGLVLAVRRLAGGFASGDPATVWLAAAAGIALVAAADVAGRHGAGLAASIAARCGLVVGMVAIAVPPRGAGWLSMAAVGLALAVVAVRPAGLRGVTRRGARQPAPFDRRSRTLDDRPQRQGRRLTPRNDRKPKPLRRDESVPGRLLQRLERFESPTGTDCLRGRVNLSIPAGGRSTHAHVGFCPAFVEMPIVEVTTEYDGVDAVVAAAEVLPWGVRVECRLSEPAEEPLEIPVDVFVKVPRERTEWPAGLDMPGRPSSPTV